jgi:uncharacterized protein YpiB (UPF0302 family)
LHGVCCVHSKLTVDLQHLRQLLHDEKEAAAAALAGSSAAKPALANASKEELLHQLDVAAAEHAKERTCNAELVHRLQQLHAEQVGARGRGSSHWWNSQTASALRLFRQPAIVAL